MRINPCYVAAFGLAVVAGHGTANAQTVITREVVGPPVETVVTQPPPPMVAEQPYETVETIQTTRPVRTITRRVTTNTRRSQRNTQAA